MAIFFVMLIAQIINSKISFIVNLIADFFTFALSFFVFNSFVKPLDKEEKKLLEDSLPDFLKVLTKLL